MPNAARLFRVASVPLALAGMYLSSLACSGLSFAAPTATPTPTPSATSTPTSTETPTETLTPTVEFTEEPTLAPTTSYLDWPVVFSDSFDADFGGWYTGKSDNEYAMADISVTGGKYLVKASSKKPFFWWFNPEIDDLADLYLTAEVQRIKSPEKSDTGIVFRARKGQYYYFFINPVAKQYGVALYYDGEWRTLLKWQYSNLIDPTASNQLAVLAQGSTFTLFLNGEEINSFEDDTLDEGQVGVALEFYKGGEYLELAFDNFTVTAPKQSR